MITPADIKSHLSYAERQGWMPYFRQASRRYGISLPVLLAVGSRETGLGTDRFYRNNNFTGRDGHGKGIMQIDDRWHSFAKMVPADDHQKMIEYGAQHLRDLKRRFSGNMKAALAAYNTGPSDVRYAISRGLDPDMFTTGLNYSADVLHRAKTIRRIMGTGLLKAAGIMLPAAILLGGGGYLYQQILKTK